MGRHAKLVIDDFGKDRREDGYYSTPNYIADFLAERLISIKPDGHLVFDPCIGRGEMTDTWRRRGKFVIGFDVVKRNPIACDEFREQDFLEYHMRTNAHDLFNIHNKIVPDYIIANPPYNCHEVDYIRSRKSQLVSMYGTSVLNMYSMFLKSIIEMAPEGCVIGVIVHDSFLTARGHSELRSYIRDNCAVHDIHLCPTSLFLDQGADVRTCLLVLQKGVPQKDAICVSNRPASILEFKERLKNKTFVQVTSKHLLLSEDRDNNEFIIGVPEEIRALFSGKRLSEFAPCITGISTGNDKKYLSPVKTKSHGIPFYKNPAKRRFYTEPDAFLISDFLEEERKVKNFMVRNKDYMFRGGLSCSSMGIHFSAALLPADGAFGVNPNIIIEDEFMRWWLLAYLNSNLCFYLVRGVIIRTNMITAGYASRIPVPEFESTTLQKLAALGKLAHEQARQGVSVESEKEKIDNLIYEALSFSNNMQKSLQLFAKDAIRLT
jgi:hypothetical protein